MAMPGEVLEKPLRRPKPRPTMIVAEHDGPVAVSSWSYLGGIARGLRVIYQDINHYVWWAPANLGYGRGAYGSGAYGRDTE